MDPEPSQSGNWGATLSRAFDATADRIPDLALALLVLVAGLFIAGLLRRATRRSGDVANRLLDRVFRRGALASMRLSPALVSVFGEVVFWIVALLALTLSLRIAGFAVIAGWFDRIVVYLPSLISGIAILVVGYLLSVFVREQVEAAARRAGLASTHAPARLAQLSIIALALIIGLDQVGVEVTLLIVLFAVLAAGLAAGLVFAFAFGAQTFVSNLIGARNARNSLEAGLRLRIGEVEGTLLEITSTQIALDTAGGKLLLPARVVEERSILILVDDREGSTAHG